jgi:hypothetical protein
VDVDDVSPALRGRLGPEATDALLATFDTTRQEWAADVITLAVERFERRLARESDALRLAAHDLEAARRQELAEITTTVREEIRLQRVEIAGWAIVFWLAQVVATAAVIATLK